MASSPNPEYLTLRPAAFPEEIVKVLLVTSADIVVPSRVAEPVTPVVVIPTPVVPTVIDPVELLEGVTEDINENVFEPNTVELAVGPDITSV